MLTLIGLTFIVLLFIFIQQQSKKLRLVKNSPVVFVYDAQVRYPNLTLKNYGIPLKTNNQSKVKVLFPTLTTYGELEYIYSWHDLSDIDVSQKPGKFNDTKLKTIHYLAPIIKYQLKIEPNILCLNEQYNQIKNLAYLVSTSDIHANSLGTYERALIQIEKLLKKTDRLQKVYIRLIREALIGIKIAEYNPDILEFSQFAVDSQYQRVKEEYQNMKDVVNAYSQLLKESRNTQL